jgi:Ca-activated chloride channel family protein
MMIFWFGDISFLHPWVLLFLIGIPILIIWYIYRRNRLRPALTIPTLPQSKRILPTLRLRFFHSMFIFRFIALIFLILAIARPQTRSDKTDLNIEGIDIVLSLDISSSMLSEDFRPNRIEAAKDVALTFIEGRPQDRIGLVVFSGESFTQCPLTIDHRILKELFKEVKSGIIEDGTALGDGLGTAVNRLRSSKAKSKVIILLTDGVNNTGFIDPMAAADMAREFGIRVYTIGVGSMGTAPYPFQTPFGVQYQQIPVEIDEPLLQQIALTTGGKYFRAVNKLKLAQIYAEIDKMEKTKIEVMSYSHKTEKAFFFILIALFAIAIELLLRNTIFRIIP